ncbi:MAG: pentapeptide repeat-containing protein, partial [Acetobacteraceae bacterium]|nr:pentapeptide repeat-containing protein [Acetobacteraceae bacterium]
MSDATQAGEQSGMQSRRFIAGLLFAAAMISAAPGQAAEHLSADQVRAITAAGEKINLSGKDMSGDDLTGLDFSGANLSGANLAGANLHGVKLSGADLNDADLSKADLTFAWIMRADFTGANLSGATMKTIVTSIGIENTPNQAA